MDIKEDIKNIIYNAIELKKQNMIEEYNERINEISSENNPAKIYYLLAETFHNTMAQGEIGIKFLKECLTNPFFKEAEITNGVNNIIFSNDDFDIMFSKCLSREIKIKYKNSGMFSYYDCHVKPSDIRLADLIETYLNKKSFKNFKALVEQNYRCSGYKNNFIAKIIKYVNTYRQCNKKLLDVIIQKQRQDEIRKIKAEDENKKYEEKQLYAKTFIDNLTDLDMFRCADWYITIIGIYTDNSTQK